MNKTPYEILSVTSSATQDEIKNAYRKLAKKYHPDLNPGNKDAEKHFKEINGAYELIGTAESREKFDRGGFEEPQPRASSQHARRGAGPFYHQTQKESGRYSHSFGGIDEDVLRSIFENMGRRGEGAQHDSSRDVTGEDALYQMDIEFKDAILGAEREITLPTGKRLRVKIPPGVESGSKLRFAGQGSPAQGRAPMGDAYVQLNVRPSPLFKRSGNDLEVELPISVSEALLGTEIKVPTIDGSILLKVPPGVASGQRLRIAGRGVPSIGNIKRGDQFITLKIVTPQTIDADFKQAVESWSKRQPFDPRANWIGTRGAAS